MKIGIYTPDTNPESGGANSLTKTIKKEILDFKDNINEYYFLYFGNENKKIIISDGFKYVNLNLFKPHIGIKKLIKHYIQNKLDIEHNIISEFDVVAKELEIDLFWFTSPVGFDISYPYIYTVWDLGHRMVPYFPEVSKEGGQWNIRERTYQRMLYRACYIITGNEEGKKEILQNYPVPEDKIRISSFPVASFCHGNEQKPNFDIPKNFFFYPAQFWPHKNHISILEALVILRNQFNIKPVVFLTGSDKGNKDYIQEKIKEYQLENQVYITGFLKDEELKYLYTHATAMIFASLMGPNNMPPIEATYLNCPVIISDLTGHKEQLGDTALYFKGCNYSELAQQIYNILTDPKLRNSLIKKEKELALEFNRINYFSSIKQIINEFSFIRKTWGK